MSKVTNKQILSNMRAFVGKRVVMLSPHPRAGEYGTTEKPEMVSGKPMMRIKLDDGSTCHGDHQTTLFVVTIYPSNTAQA